MDSSDTSAAPKKLKLTLKLNSNNNNSNSSSNSSTNNSSNPSSSSTPASSGISSKIDSSPIKSSTGPVAAAPPLIDLPSGLGNLKGRGRPKKSQVSVNESVSGTTIPETTVTTSNPATASTTTSNPTATASSDYAAELKSFVTAMKSFKPRSWSLHQPASFELKNVAGYEIVLPAGLWCTATSELGSALLQRRTAEQLTMNTEESAVFEAKCQCGKVFNDKSKYRKHAKIHEKDKAQDNVTVTDSTTLNSSVPVISLKLKINTSHQ